MDPKGQMAVEEGVNLGENAKRTREWGVATSSALAMTGCKTLAAAHDLMKLSHYHIVLRSMPPPR